MFIENLVRMGQAFLARGADTADTLGAVTDVLNSQAAGFFKNVLIVEVDEEGLERPLAPWPIQDWTTTRVQGRREVVEVKGDIAIAAPFTLPKGGNPRKAQGRYPVPAYMVLENDLIRFDDPQVVEEFLAGRWPRTIEGTSAPIPVVAQAVAEQVGSASLNSTGKNRKLMGLLLILPVRDQGVYRYVPAAGKPEQAIDLGPSMIRPDQRVFVDLQALLKRVWEAKSEEGAEMGRMQGECLLCHRLGDVVSIYSKAWPWFSITWEAPFSVMLPQDRLVEGAGLCISCYAALTQGAQLFAGLTRRLPQWLTRELFAPVDSPQGQETARKGATPATIFGTGLVLPLVDDLLQKPEVAEPWVDGLHYMTTQGDKGGWGRHLDSVAGFELVVPDPLLTDHYRITLVYFSGQPERGDIHLRAVIEDVVPSVLTDLDHVLIEVMDRQRELIEVGSPSAGGDIGFGWRSIPSLLIRAYGPGYLWQNMEALLRRRPLSYGRFVRNVALRLSELARRVGDPQRLARMRHEVRFYVVFRDFWWHYHRQVAAVTFDNREVIPIRHWRELQTMLRQQPVGDLEFNDVEELAFAIGDLTRQFARQYYVHNHQRDFLQHRVITFGSNLTPDAILRNALYRFPEYAGRLKMPLSERFRQLNGALIVHVHHYENEIRKQPDRFMAGFWAGYLLEDLSRPKRTEQEEGVPFGEPSESDHGAGPVA